LPLRKSNFKTLTVTLILSAMLAGGGLSAMAEEPAKEPSFPRSVFVPVPPSENMDNEEYEIISDLEVFEAAGYHTADFDTYYNLRHDVGREVVVPDYVRRTGRIPPEDVRVEVGAVYLTGGDFNDIVVYSFLPGDCEIGCTTQIYRTKDGKKWEKILEFKSMAFAYKNAQGDTPTEVVAVGGTGLASRIFTWTGLKFEEKR